MAKTNIKQLTGSPVKLSFGDFRVSEPPLLTILELVQEVPEILKALAAANFTEEGDDNDNIKEVMALLLSPQVRSTFFRALASVLTPDVSASELEAAKTSDVLKIIKTLKQEVDWEDLKQTFFQVVPRENLSQMFPSLISAEETSGKR